MDTVLETTTGADPRVQTLVAALGAELTARYGDYEPGAGPSAQTDCLLVSVAGRPVGCVALTRPGGQIGVVTRMYVDPTARGRRIGRLLVQRVEQLAAERGCRRLRLMTGVRQPEALRLYDSAGWSRVECQDGDHPTTVCFEKAISGPPADRRCPDPPAR
jgi:GNAT superfamily N-acetyltransferase